MEKKNKNNIIFIGMSAAGKSTIGVVAAKRLGYEFIDTDLLIQKREKRLLKEILEQEGNERFLEIENEVNSTLEADRAVISPGGSVIYEKEAMEHFRKIGIIVYLQASFETINSRIRNPKERGIVLKDGQTLRELYEERAVLFEKYADLIVNEDGLSLSETIEQVLEVLKK